MLTRRIMSAIVGMNRALLACGIASSLVYVAANVLGAVVWPEYSSASQTISELSAIDAPSRSTWLPLGIAYDVLLGAFAIGVWRSARNRRGLRIAACLLFAIAAFGLVWPPMHMRGSVPTLTDTLHAAGAALVSVLILLAIGLGSTAFGRGFRRYSIATLVLLLASGLMTFREAPHLEAGLPTPWIGVYERIDLGGYLIWLAVLAIALLRERQPASASRPDSASESGARRHTPAMAASRSTILCALILAVVGCSRSESKQPAASETHAAPATPVAKDPGAARSLIDKGAVVIDVRSPDEYAGGHVPNAVNIPVQELPSRLAEVDKLVHGDKGAPIVVYCAAGGRAAKAKTALDEAGYGQVVNGGGFKDLAPK